MIRKLLRWMGMALGGLLILWILVGTGLALTPAPRFTAAPLRLPPGVELPPPGCGSEAAVRCLTTRDGTVLTVLQTGAGRDAIILLHGVMGDARRLDSAAALLHAATGATVVRPDLRGHGLSGGPRGDVDRIGRYEQDVAELVVAVRREHPDGRVVLAGHSMGGGIAMRYADRSSLPPVDGYLLLAPHLGATSPTSRPRRAPAGGPEAPMKLHVKRTIGLVMLNVLGIRALNGLETLYFNVGEEFPIRAYSYRAMAGMAPEDHRRALQADARPMLVVVGAGDEAFDASAYPAVIGLHRNGRTVVVPGVGHDGIVTSAATADAARGWFAGLAPSRGRGDSRSNTE